MARPYGAWPFWEVSPWGSFLFTPQRQKKVCTPGDEAVMKIHKLFSGIPITSHFLLYLQNYKEFEAEILDLQIEKYGLSFDILKKMYYFRLSPGGWKCDLHKVL